MGVRKESQTHVIQAPDPAPKAICHAGSSAWKYSSGWKKVRTHSAFTKRKRMSRLRMSNLVWSSRSLSLSSLPVLDLGVGDGGKMCFSASAAGTELGVDILSGRRFHWWWGFDGFYGRRGRGFLFCWGWNTRVMMHGDFRSLNWRDSLYGLQGQM